jgi:hypothetical protein
LFEPLFPIDSRLASFTELFPTRARPAYKPATYSLESKESQVSKSLPKTDCRLRSIPIVLGQLPARSIPAWPNVSRYDAATAYEMEAIPVFRVRRADSQLAAVDAQALRPVYSDSV